MKVPRPRGIKAVLATVVVASTLVLTPAAPAGATPPTLPAPNSNGITLRGWTQVTASEGNNVARLLDATMTTAAIMRPGTNPTINPVQRQVKVRILLPANYQTNPAQPYPVLYLLHGGASDWRAWSNGGDGNVKSIVGSSPFRGIVVMPEGGRAGWYSDWAGQTDGRFAPQWETFHIQQLIPWIDANFNTIEDRSGRAIAGLSMGGLGALLYAGRFPSQFSAVGSFSGGTDISEPDAQATVADSLWQAGASIVWDGFFDGDWRVSGSTLFRMRTVFGPEGASGRWDSKNPYQLANRYNAYDTRFGLYSGGIPSGETGIGGWNNKFHAQLSANGVDHRYCAGAGTHSWGYWREDLKDFLQLVYGTTPASCPNGWGSPTP